MGQACAANEASGGDKQAEADGEEPLRPAAAQSVVAADASTAPPSTASSGTAEGLAASGGAGRSSEALWQQQVRAEAELASATCADSAEAQPPSQEVDEVATQEAKGKGRASLHNDEATVAGREQGRALRDEDGDGAAPAKPASSEAAPKEKKADGKSSKTGSSKKKESARLAANDSAGSAPKAKAKEVKAKAKPKTKAEASCETSQAAPTPEASAAQILSVQDREALKSERATLWKAMSKEERRQMSDRLISASGSGDKATVTALLEQGAKANASDIDGRNAWRSAAKSGRIPVLEMLLATGTVDVNATNKFNGQTALHYACMRNLKDTVYYLVLDAGMDRTLQSTNGKTAADMLQDKDLAEWLSAPELSAVRPT